MERAVTAPSNRWLRHSTAVVVAGSCLINADILFPYLYQINPFDETGYITSGYQLLQGVLPQYTQNPLVAVIFALVCLPVQDQPLWFVLSEWAGRLMIVGLLWASLLIMALRHRAVAHPVIPALLMFASPALP